MSIYGLTIERLLTDKIKLQLTVEKQDQEIRRLKDVDGLRTAVKILGGDTKNVVDYCENEYIRVDDECKEIIRKIKILYNTPTISEEDKNKIHLRIYALAMKFLMIRKEELSIEKSALRGYINDFVK